MGVRIPLLVWGLVGCGVLFASDVAQAAQAEPLELPVLSAAPFVLMLAAIAILPLVAGHFWHSNLNKAIVALLLAVPTAGYMLYLGPQTGHASTHRLWHSVEEYLSFIILLTALYVISGGILLTGDLRAYPSTNTAFLATGAVLANFIGTTGASMILIRPMLRTNSERHRVRHIPIFFIFIVSNCGGLLTPLGDPPLFLGFLGGVDFFWTLSLWQEWLFVNGLLLTLFYFWDRREYARESPSDILLDETMVEPLRLRGLRVNGPMLLGVLLAVVMQSKVIGQAVGAPFGIDATLGKPWGEVLMIVCTVIAYWQTPASLRHENRFSWGPMVEVAVLFIGIFVTMAPAMALLERHGPSFGVERPWQYFWLTGIMSSMLDNAPTYLSFATMAAQGRSLGQLSLELPQTLAAISCGAVFMGANTYIGNGPNFMVKAIAEESGYRMPSFVGFLFYSGGILSPIFLLTTLLFF